MISSGTTPIATTGDTAVTLLTGTLNERRPYVMIVNEGGVAGFYSTDNGNTWARLIAASSGPIVMTIPTRQTSGQAFTLKVKRVAAGSNLSGLYASAD